MEGRILDILTLWLLPERGLGGAGKTHLAITAAFLSEPVKAQSKLDIGGSFVLTLVAQ